jgi:hypothetical protein
MEGRSFFRVEQAMSTAAKATYRDPAYAAEIRLIHTARNALALTEDSYRGIILRFSDMKTDSSAKLTGPQRRKVIEHFRTLGFIATAKKPVVALADRRGGRANPDYRPQVGKLSALWYALYQLGIVRDGSQEACAAFVRRHSGIQVMRWNHAEDLRTAIECLKGWGERMGYSAVAYTSATGTPQEGSFKPGLIEAQWERLKALGAFRHGAHAGLDTWMHKMGWPVSHPAFLEDVSAEEAIRRLGSWIRRITPASPDHSEGAGDG